MEHQELKRGDIIFLNNAMCDVIKPMDELGMVKVSVSNNANRSFSICAYDWEFMGTDGSYYKIFEKYKDFDLGI